MCSSIIETAAGGFPDDFRRKQDWNRAKGKPPKKTEDEKLQSKPTREADSVEWSEETKRRLEQERQRRSQAFAAVAEIFKEPSLATMTDAKLRKFLNDRVSELHKLKTKTRDDVETWKELNSDVGRARDILKSIGFEFNSL